MPPKVPLPHGLKKSPFDLSRAEFGIFAVLSTSVGLGIYQLSTSPWGETSDKNITKKEERDRPATTNMVNDDGSTRVDFGK